jgi:hypothetical protein
MAEWTNDTHVHGNDSGYILHNHFTKKWQQNGNLSLKCIKYIL